MAPQSAPAPAPAPKPARRIGWLPIVVWLLAMAAAVTVVVNARYSSDMSAFLPRDPDERQRLLVDQIKDGALSRLLMVAIEGGTPDARADASRKLAERLRTSGDFSAVVNGDEASRQVDQRFLLERRYALSPAVTAERFSAQGLREAIGQSIEGLGGSAGLVLKALFPRDPTGELLQVIDRLADGSMPSSSGGVWTSSNGSRALLMAMTSGAGTDTDGQQAMLERVRAAFAQAAPGDSLKLVMSGTPVFAVHARATIKSEVEKLSLAGSLGVFTLLLLVYRSLRNVLIGLIPVASGILVAIAAVALGFDTVHAITIGFGTTLIGESIDYSIYYLVQADDPDHWRATYWPTIRLGVATSLCGFAALLFSSFPGLAQLGLYSIAGLVAAALITRYLLPALPTAPVQMGPIERLGGALMRVANGMRRLRWVMAALTLAAVVAVLGARGNIWADGLSGLNPAPLDMQQVDADLRSDAGAPDMRYMVVVSAPSQDGALLLSEQVERAMEPLRQSGQLPGLRSPAHFLPSVATQRARVAALPEPSALQQRLNEALEGQPVSAERLAPFLADVQAARAAPAITAEGLKGTSFGFAVQTLLLQRQGGWSALMPLRLKENATEAEVADARKAVEARLHSVAPAEQAFFIDLQQQTGSMFGQYLVEAWGLGLAGALAVVALLTVSLRSATRVLRVMLPLAASVILVMAGHVVLKVPMTLLHLVGLLLIVAVGSNYALFFDQKIRPEDDAAGGADRLAGRVALASLGLANVSTMIGFGVLALSKVPVLNAIGSTVGPGALLALLLSMSWSGRWTRGRPARDGSAQP